MTANGALIHADKIGSFDVQVGVSSDNPDLNASNNQAKVRVIVTADTTPPVFTAFKLAAVGFDGVNTVLDFTVSAVDNLKVTELHFEVKAPGQTQFKEVDGTGTNPFVFRHKFLLGMTGTFTYRVRAVDAAGNSSFSPELTFTPT